MWNNIFFLSLFFLPLSFQAHGQLETDVTLEKIKTSQALPFSQENQFKFSVFFDSLSRENRLPRSQNTQTAQIRELSLGVNYRIQKELDLFFEASAETFDGESQFFVSQAYMTLDFVESYFSAQVGQLFYPVAWLNEQDNYFLSRPEYYNVLFKGKKGIDIGAIARLHPLNTHDFALEASCFEGRVFRASDQRSGSPETRPCTIGARYQSEQWDAYYTHFEHDLAYYDEIKADGIGFRWQSPIQNNLWGVGLWGEYWRIKSLQQEGPPSLITGSFLYPHLDVWNFRFAYRMSPTKSEVSYNQGKVISEIEDELFRVEYRILSPLRLIYEDLSVTQKGGNTLRDEWAVRLLLEL